MQGRNVVLFFVCLIVKVQTINICRQVSRHWCNVIASQTLWFKQFHRKWGGLILLPNQDSRKGINWNYNSLIKRK
jgi:hypothetical protein